MTSVTTTSINVCELCQSPGGQVIWCDAGWRLIRVGDTAFPGFYRLVHQAHIAEFSELPEPARQRCMDLLAWAERLIIRHLRPTKMNLASLGNMVPHLHWHLIARFDWDSHFPGPVWAQAQRPLNIEQLGRLEGRLALLDAELATGPT